MQSYPLIAPQPPQLSDMADGLRRIEASGIYSNNGPEVRAFEAGVTARLFGGNGASLAVGNATLGLMIALRQAAGMSPAPGSYALMPAMTFAATAQAAHWAGLTPLICDIDEDDWGACPIAEERLLAELGDRIAVVMPYATFGSAIDLDRYAWLQRQHGTGVVIDAAASLGTIDDAGHGFGADAPFAVVHSLHATKTFAVAEGGLIHSGNADLIAQLRHMTNFGFEAGRSATLPGINAKMPEVIALMAQAKLDEIEQVCARRAAVEAAYRDALGAAATGFTLQAVQGQRRASQFMPLLLPPELAARRADVIATLSEAGVGAGTYFSPHLGEQPWFHAIARIEPTPVADTVAARMLSLPITDAMTPDDAVEIVDRLVGVCRIVGAPTRKPAEVARPAIASVTVIGGGPAGTAMLTAASKSGRLADLARSGLVLVDRDDRIGAGRLGRYAITSDSTAQTFLTAVRDNPCPTLAAIADQPVAHAVDRHAEALGVQLVEAGPLLRATGEELARLVSAEGGTVLRGHDVTGATLGKDGLWRVHLRRLSDGHCFDQLSRAIVVATGGHQPIDRLVAAEVAGARLLDLAGDRLLQADDVLALGGMETVGDLLAGVRAPRIAVIGGSTSALATVALLLKRVPAFPFGAGGVTLLHRRPLRPFYPSVEAAHADGFTDFGPDDICPVSGFVYRLAGFRLEARELVLRMLEVGGRAADPRVRCHRIAPGTDMAAQTILRDSDLVVSAMGYRPYGLTLNDASGARMALAADAGSPMVDKHCRIVAADGAPVPGAFGIGLAAGFVPWGRLGGEKSFRGQANGLWLWQNDVGQMIVDQLLDTDAARAVA